MPFCSSLKSKFTVVYSPYLLFSVELFYFLPVNGTIFLFGKGVDPYDIAWFFIAGNSPAHKINQFLFCQFGFRLQDADRLDPFAKLRIRNSDDGDFLHIWMFKDDLFDFHRIDIFSTRLDQFFFSLPPCKPKVTVLVETTCITRMVPAVSKSVFG